MEETPLKSLLVDEYILSYFTSIFAGILSCPAKVAGMHPTQWRSIERSMDEPNKHMNLGTWRIGLGSYLIVSYRIVSSY